MPTPTAKIPAGRSAARPRTWLAAFLALAMAIVLLPPQAVAAPEAGLGDVVLHKAVTGDHAPSAWEFEFDLTCTDQEDQVVTLSDATPSESLTALAGSRCTVAERSPSGASTTTVNDRTRTSLDFTVREGESFDVRFTNRFDVARPALVPDYRTVRFLPDAPPGRPMLTADLKGDGRDAILSYDESGRWWMTSWDAEEGRWASEVIATYSTILGWLTHLKGDFTGNGNDDLLSYHPKSRRLWVTTWDEDEGAWDTFLLTTLRVAHWGWTVLAGNVIGDERAELLSGRDGRWWITSWDQEAGGFVWEPFVEYATLYGWEAHLTGDVTGNGYDGFLSYHPSRGRWWVTSWDEDEERFVSELYTTYEWPGHSWWHHRAGDITGNGYDDLLSFRPVSARWWLTSWNDDARRMDTRSLATYATMGGWIAHLLGDMTGNGRDDLVSFHYQGRSWITTDVNDPGPS
jgi:hypothetical protein